MAPMTPGLHAAELPDGDVLRILLEQHARIRELFRAARAAQGEHRRRHADELRALLAVHETAEEMVPRPVTERVAGREVADARNQEEAEATEMLSELEHTDVESPEFDTVLDTLETMVLRHAELEEQEEFPVVLAPCDADRRQKMGGAVRAAESIAPTHPHEWAAGSPVRQWAAGPFASLLDRARDAIRGVTGPWKRTSHRGHTGPAAPPVGGLGGLARPCPQPVLWTSTSPRQPCGKPGGRSCWRRQPAPRRAVVTIPMTMRSPWLMTRDDQQTGPRHGDR